MKVKCLLRLPENVSMEEGALMEPLSVGVHACNRAAVTVGKSVLVLGAGPIGLVSMMCARAYGAARVVVTDIADNRLRVAKELGADDVVNVLGLGSPVEVARIIAEKYFHYEQPNITIECSGAESSIQMGLLATR